MELPSGTVTFLFTDIEGSTRLVETLGDLYNDCLAAHSEIIEGAVAGSAGVVVNTEGDSYFCVFRKAANAVAAAVQIQEGMEAYPWPRDGELKVRIGIHTGEGVAGGRDYVGLDVHRAARIAAAGYGGQVLLSAETRALASRQLPEGVTIAGLGSFHLRDLDEPEIIYQLVVPGLISDFPALRSVGGRTHNLPAMPNRFIGRYEDLKAIEGQLRDTRLVTLIGPGGTGKTRLALESGHRLLSEFPDGVWLFELASLSDPRGIWQSLAASLRLREMPGTSPPRAVIDFLQQRSTLLILDNCEHLVEASADLVRRLLDECAHLRVLATSRRPIGLAVERVHPVPGLATPDADTIDGAVADFEAVQLFVDRARERRPGFELSGDVLPAVAQICSRLDGIPLAIELAAARVGVLPPHQIACRLDDRFRILTMGSKTSIAHHETLRVALDWSYDLLTEEEASLLRCLGGFGGAFSLEALESICGAALRTQVPLLDLLQSLVEQSLVAVDEDKGRFRYRLLETVRLYTLDKLDASGEGPLVFRAHADYYMQVAGRAELALQGSGDAVSQAEILDALDDEHDEYRAAMSRMLDVAPHTAMAIAAAIWRFWEIRGHLNEGSEWLRSTLSASRDAPAQTRAKALAGAGKLAWRRGVFTEAEPLFRESLELWRQIGDRDGEANALHGLARAALNLGDAESALEWGTESLAIQREVGNKQGTATAINTLGEIARFNQDYEEARTRYLESLRIYEEIGDTAATISVRHNLGYTALGQADIETAEARFLEAMILARDLNDHLGIFSMFGALAGVAIAKGDAERAATLFGAADNVAADGYAGDRVDQLEVERNLMATREKLDPSRFDVLWREGGRMELSSAIEYALGLSESVSGR